MLLLIQVSNEPQVIIWTRKHFDLQHNIRDYVFLLFLGYLSYLDSLSSSFSYFNSAKVYCTCPETWYLIWLTLLSFFCDSFYSTSRLIQFHNPESECTTRCFVHHVQKWQLLTYLGSYGNSYVFTCNVQSSHKNVNMMNQMKWPSN